ncbi:MAG: hypothetical protein R2695_08815 [Acidimicrobiales bacterium]
MVAGAGDVGGKGDVHGGAHRLGANLNWHWSVAEWPPEAVGVAAVAVAVPPS